MGLLPLRFLEWTTHSYRVFHQVADLNWVVILGTRNFSRTGLANRQEGVTACNISNLSEVDPILVHELMEHPLHEVSFIRDTIKLILEASKQSKVFGVIYRSH